MSSWLRTLIHGTSVFSLPQVFFYFGITDRLRDMLENPAMAKLLRLPEGKQPAAGEPVCDITQSEAWQHYVVKGLGRPGAPAVPFGEDDIVLALNLDGFQPWARGGKARPHSMTPLSLMILNLPENMRHKGEYMLLAGLIPGPKAPADQNPYLRVLVDEINHLTTHGITIERGGVSTKHRVKLLCVCADYPAHEKNNNQQGASATWGCIKCYSEVRAYSRLMQLMPGHNSLCLTFALLCAFFACMCSP